MRLGLGVSIPGTSSLVQAAFSPLDLSPVLWLDASDTSTITEVGGAVSQWDNKGSLGDFTQGTAADQPTTGSTTLNGLNVIDFANDHVVSTDAASAWNDLHNGTTWIAAYVAYNSSSTSGSFNGLFGTSVASQSVGAAVISDDSGASEAARVSVSRNVLNSYAVTNTGNTASFPFDTWIVGSLLTDPDNATAADRSVVFTDGGTAQKNNTLADAVSVSNATNTLRVGATGSTTVPGIEFTGSIAELIIVTGANATESNRQALRDYLNNKWAVY
jgi:hypothetical protein